VPYILSFLKVTIITYIPHLQEYIYGHEDACPGDGHGHCSEVTVGANGAELECQEGDELFRRAPTLALDGVTYTPNVYPHPLVTGGSADTIDTIAPSPLFLF
jgi:hypothetical protein